MPLRHAGKKSQTTDHRPPCPLHSQRDDSRWEDLGDGLGVHAEGTVSGAGAGGRAARRLGGFLGVGAWGQTEAEAETQEDQPEEPQRSGSGSGSGGHPVDPAVYGIRYTVYVQFPDGGADRSDSERCTGETEHTHSHSLTQGEGEGGEGGGGGHCSSWLSLEGALPERTLQEGEGGREGGRKTNGSAVCA